MTDPAPSGDPSPAADTAAASAGAGAVEARRRGLIHFLRRHLTPRLSAAIVIWQAETRTVTLLATVLVITLGRWPAAFAMGSIMAVYSALFLFLLDGEPAMEAFREWAEGRRFVKRRLLPMMERQDRVGTAQRVASVPLLIAFTGPFWRAIILHAFRVRRALAYVISVGGSIPHSLLWTGLFLGGLWEELIWPFLDAKLF